MKWSDLILVKKLGEGHSGAVWLAENHDSRTCASHPRVAVKRYKRWIVENPGHMERLVRELLVGRQITHPNLVRSIELVSDDEGMPCLVMEHINGVVLTDFFRERVYRITLDELVRITLGLAAALDSLHSRGVIHRDIKPDNVMLVDGNPVLMDLGVIKPPDFPQQTTTGEFLGTIRYAAPESLFESHTDAKSDLFSLGLILCEMLYQSQYLASISNWAEIVIGKSRWFRSRLGDKLAFSKWPEAFATEYGTATTDYFLLMLSRLLCPIPERVDSAKWLISHLEAREWNSHFWVENGEITLSIPEYNLGGDSELEHAKSSLATIARIMTSRFTHIEKAHLREAMSEYYKEDQSYPVCWSFDRFRDREYSRLLTDFRFCISEYGSDAEWGLRLGPLIQDLYRFDYL